MLDKATQLRVSWEEFPIRAGAGRGWLSHLLFSPTTPTSHSLGLPGRSWALTPGQGSRWCDTGRHHPLQPWPQELRPEAQVAPGTLPEGWREGKGWSLRLDPPADTGSAGRAWHWAGDPPRLPLLGCAVSAEQWSASKFAETRGESIELCQPSNVPPETSPRSCVLIKEKKKIPWLGRSLC